MGDLRYQVEGLGLFDNIYFPCFPFRVELNLSNTFFSSLQIIAIEETLVFVRRVRTTVARHCPKIPKMNLFG